MLVDKKEKLVTVRKGGGRLVVYVESKDRVKDVLSLLNIENGEGKVQEIEEEIEKRGRIEREREKLARESQKLFTRLNEEACAKAYKKVWEKKKVRAM